MLLRVIFFVCAVVFAAHASAQSTFVTPAQPRAGAAVDAVVAFSGCRPLTENNVDGGTHRIFGNGNRIDLVVSIRELVCGVPPGPINSVFALGAFEEGEYTLNLYEVMYDQPFPATVDGLSPYETITFGVSGAPAAVPTLRNAGIAVLLIFITLLAAVRLRQPV